MGKFPYRGCVKVIMEADNDKLLPVQGGKLIDVARTENDAAENEE